MQTSMGFAVTSLKTNALRLPTHSTYALRWNFRCWISNGRSIYLQTHQPEKQLPGSYFQYDFLYIVCWALEWDLNISVNCRFSQCCTVLVWQWETRHSMDSRCVSNSQVMIWFVAKPSLLALTPVVLVPCNLSHATDAHIHAPTVRVNVQPVASHCLFLPCSHNCNTITATV